MAILLIGGFILIIYFDMKTILKNKDKRTYFVYALLIMVGFIINLLLVIDRVPTSPAIVIERIVTSLIH